MEEILIKKYDNRRLYCVNEARYISLAEVAGYLREGGQVRVVEKSTGDDITSQVLAQAILEDRGADLPVFFLRLIMQTPRPLLDHFFRDFFLPYFEYFVRVRESQTLGGQGGGAPFGGGYQYMTNPFGGAPFGGAPFGGAPFGGAPFGGAPFGGAPFGGAPFKGNPFVGDANPGDSPGATPVSKGDQTPSPVDAASGEEKPSRRKKRSLKPEKGSEIDDARRNSDEEKNLGGDSDDRVEDLLKRIRDLEEKLSRK